MREHTDTLCIWAKQVANCLHFCLHFFENCVALISINFYVGQHCDLFSFRNDTTCHLVPLANCPKSSIKTFFMQLHLFFPCFFPPLAVTEYPPRSRKEGWHSSWGKLSLPGDSRGFWAARGSSPQLFNPREGKVLICTKDTHISSAHESWAPCAVCTVVSAVNTSTILFQIP